MEKGGHMTTTNMMYSSTRLNEEFHQDILDNDEFNFLVDNEDMFNMSDEMFEQHLFDLTEMRDHRK